MLHVFLSVLLLLVATCARADWVKVGENDGAVRLHDAAAGHHRTYGFVQI